MTTKKPLVMRKGEGERLMVPGGNLTFLCPASKTDRAWSLLEAELPLGAGPPPHEHSWDEAYYVIEGEVRFTLGTETIVVKAGDFIYAPGGTVHAFSGLTETPARILVFDAPAGAENFFRDIGRETKSLPDDLAKVRQIGKKHGLRFL